MSFCVDYLTNEITSVAPVDPLRPLARESEASAASTPLNSPLAAFKASKFREEQAKIDVEHLKGALSTQLDLLFSQPSSTSNSNSNSPSVKRKASQKIPSQRSLALIQSRSEDEEETNLASTTVLDTTADSAEEEGHIPKCLGMSHFVFLLKIRTYYMHVSLQHWIDARHFAEDFSHYSRARFLFLLS